MTARKPTHKVILRGVCFIAALYATESIAIDEITVTARKKLENLQKVPIAIDVIGGDQIQELAIRDLDDVMRFTPSLTFDESFNPQDTKITVRGVPNTRGRSNVAFLVDGIDVTSQPIGAAGSSILVNQRLLDVERIEVVKGPQSALYGRSAFAGALSYVSKEPGDEFAADGGIELNNNNDYELRGAIGGPINDVLAFRLNGVVWEEDGHYRNSVSGNKTGGGEGSGVALTITADPSERVQLKGRISYSDDEYDPRSVAILPFDRVVPVPTEANDLDVTPRTFVTVATGGQDADDLAVTFSENPRTGKEYPGQSLELLRMSFVADWDAANGTFTSYTGFTNAEDELFIDQDYQAIGRPDTLDAHSEVHWLNDTRQFSQELRYESGLDGSVQYTVGGLYWREDRERDDAGVSLLCFPELFGGPCTEAGGTTWQEAVLVADPESTPRFSANEIRSMSVYGLVEWQVNDDWKATFEARFIDEKQELSLGVPSCSLIPNVPDFLLGGFLDQFARPDCPPTVQVEDFVNSSYWTPRVIVEWEPSDNLLTYASLSKGEKPAGIAASPGGFGVPTVEQLNFDAEKLTAWEVGAKSDLEGDFGSLRLNGALFYQDYSDKQVITQQIDPDSGFLSPVITNAAKAVVKGYELEANWLPASVDGLSVNLAYTHLLGEYRDFEDITASAERIALAGECVEPMPVPDDPQCLIDLSGNDIERVPQKSFVATVSYTTPAESLAGRLPDADWLFETNVQFQDERYFDSDNTARLDDYTRVDARAGLTGENWYALFFVDNLFDDLTPTTGGVGPDLVAALRGPNAFRTAFWYNLPQPRTSGIRVGVEF